MALDKPFSRAGYMVKVYSFPLCNAVPAQIILFCEADIGEIVFLLIRENA